MLGEHEDDAQPQDEHDATRVLWKEFDGDSEVRASASCNYRHNLEDLASMFVCCSCISGDAIAKAV